MKYILIATDNQEAADVIQKCFKSNYSVKHVLDYKSCLDLFDKTRIEFLFIDIKLLKVSDDENDYKEKLRPFWKIAPDTEIIILTDANMIRETVSAVKAGASNYLTYPPSLAEVKYIIETIRKDIQFHAELKYLRNQFWRKDAFTILKTNSPLMKNVFEKIRAVAETDSTVLISGETGTGKGVIAKLIHTHSQRKEKQFISVHCGSIPDTLLESELFGHEKGAFTGAIRKKLGKFEIANGGTIFLDEIGTISSSTQIKLLEVLQDKTFQHVGGETTLASDVRIIAATNEDLKQRCEEGTFRKDLYYRLLIFPIEIPPLRERKEDISLIIETFLERLNRFSSKKIRDVHPDVIRALEEYNWPGNIREMENLIERAYILETSLILTPSSFPKDMFENINERSKPMINTELSLEEIRRLAVENVEKEYLLKLIAKNLGKINKTAEDAGIGVRQLHNLLLKYGIQKSDFKTDL